MIGSHRLVAAHFRNSGSNTWISHALWFFARSFILAHISPFVKPIGSWMFGTKWSLMLCLEVCSICATIYCFLWREWEGKNVFFFLKLLQNKFVSLINRCSFFVLCFKWERFLCRLVVWYSFVRYSWSIDWMIRV